MITTNAIARTQGALAEQQRTIYAITAQIAELQDRAKETKNEIARHGWMIACIELQQLQRTLEQRTAA